MGVDEPRETVRGGAFYDRPGVFERFREPHEGLSNPVVVMEEPALLDELGSVAGLRVLDLGCGDGALGRVLLEGRCRSYLGIDGSERMVRAARETLASTAGDVVRTDIEDFSAPPDTYDLVVSRLALHYVEDLAAVLGSAYGCLSPGGRLVFTVVHPVVTSHDARQSTEELRTSWVVDDYFIAGPRQQQWLGGEMIWHHRTIEAQVDALRGAGFALTAVRECSPRQERFGSDTAEFIRRQRVPMFLLLAGVRA
jgi:SAM-dependent methyltransferase